MAQRKLKVGIIGTGFGRAVQIPGFQRHPETEVVAVCSQRRERAEAVASEFALAHAFDDYRAMLALPELDIVSIVTPPYLHHEMTIAALEAGKHVLCEKPMAMNVAEAEAMARKAETLSLVGMIDHVFRFVPSRSRLKELVAEGYLGDLRSVTVVWISGFLNDSPDNHWGWLSEQSKGGGALGGVGSHALDLLLWWFDDIVRCVGHLDTLIKARPLPRSTDMRPVETDDWFMAAVEFRNGGQGILHVNAAAHHGIGVAIEMHGSQGTLIVDKAGHLLGARRGESQLEELPIPARLASPPGASEGARVDFLWLVERLVRAIRDGGDASPSFLDGLRCQRVMDAIAQSARAGRWVAVEAGSDS